MEITPASDIRRFVRYAAPAVVGIFVLVACLLVADSYRTTAHADTSAVAPNSYTQGSIDGVVITLELATTDEAQTLGLGGRASIPDDYGMLFIFPMAADYGFWMKDMQVPIDIFWLDSLGQVVTIKEDVATSTYPTVFYPTADASYVLETAAGFARVHEVKLGDTLLGLPSADSVSK